MGGVWVCAGCGCRYAAGAPRCPECPSSEHEEAGFGDEDPSGWHEGDEEGSEEAEAVEVPKILPNGTVTYEPGREPAGASVPAVAADAEPAGDAPSGDDPAAPASETDGQAPAEPDAVPVTEAPAPSPAPAARPPRRSPPGAP